MRITRRVCAGAIAVAFCALVGFGVHLWSSGYQLYIVHTGSMAPTLSPGALVLDRPANRDYHAGQIITFRHAAASDDVVTHRITDITSSGIVHTKGDANATDDVWDIRPNQVQGVVTNVVPYAGYAAVFLRQPTGLASALTAVIALMLLWGLFFPSDTATDSAVVPAVAQQRRRAKHARPRAQRPARPSVRAPQLGQPSVARPVMALPNLRDFTA